MVEELPAVELKSGEIMQVSLVTAPDEQWGPRLVHFMYLRNPEYTNINWHHNCARVLRGDYRQVSHDVFFVGLLDDDIVGTAWYGAPGDTLDVATFGRVITRENERRKGIAAVLCKLAVEHFRRLGGRAMYLGTGRTNPARFIYETLGFEHYNYIEDEGTIMRLVLSGDAAGFEAEYYQCGAEVCIRPLHAGDLARVEMLYNLPLWACKDSSLGIMCTTPFEGEFYDILAHIEQPGEAGLALVTDDRKRLMGMAYTSAAPGHQSGRRHMRHIEFLVHPNYTRHGSELVKQAEERAQADNFIAHVAASDADKLTIIEQAGYRQVGRLARAIKSDHAETDMLIFQKC